MIRMIPIARRIAAAGAGRLAVFRLLNSTRGWDERHSPVEDVRWALGEIAKRSGGRLPACLVGHSLGGRAAILGVTLPGVRSAAAMAPWVYADDVPPGLDGQEILIVHGSRDRIANPQRSATLAEALARHTPVRYLQIEGGKHAMLRHGARYQRLAAHFTRDALLDPVPR